MPTPKLQAIFAKQDIEGDDTLLRLAQFRFHEAGVGAEFYPGSPEHFQQLLHYRPFERPCSIHLPRNLNLLQPDHHHRIIEFARKAAGNAHGMVVHDHGRFAEQPDATLDAFRAIDARLKEIPYGPWLFVEYAAGLQPDFFASLFERTRNLQRVSACIDVSHVGIRVCQIEYGRLFPGQDVCWYKPDHPGLRDAIGGVQLAVEKALPTTVELIGRLAQLGKPLHFHLHDGHPSSTLSKYGVSDHLSFLQEIRLPFAFEGRNLLRGMYGPRGLRRLIAAALPLGPEKLSFMLEIHPQPGRSPLGAHGDLFKHWRDVANAERMNAWVDVLMRDAQLVRDGWSA